jgi:hypothetical protein
MVTSNPPPGKKFFTVAEANATLPLVRAIVRDVTELARELRERHERLNRDRPDRTMRLSEAHEEELAQARQDLEWAKQRMQGYEEELAALGVELKDYFAGLVDFPSRMGDRVVYLCWRLGEPAVGFWHELGAGYAGRQKLDLTPPAGESRLPRTPSTTDTPS